MACLMGTCSIYWQIRILSFKSFLTLYRKCILMLANICFKSYSIKLSIPEDPISPNKIVKPIWGEFFFRIYAKRSHSNFCFTMGDIVAFEYMESFWIGISQKRVVQMPISNLLDSGCDPVECQERAYRVLLQTLQNMRHVLGLCYGKVKLFMDHSWTLLRMKKGVSDET